MKYYDSYVCSQTLTELLRVAERDHDDRYLVAEHMPHDQLVPFEGYRCLSQ